MDPVTIERIREATTHELWAMTRHARERAGRRRIGDEELVTALANGEVIEDYPTDPRGPSALVLGHTGDGRAVHAVCAFDPSGTLLVVTVYEPKPPRWVNERTRGEEGDL